MANMMNLDRPLDDIIRESRASKPKNGDRRRRKRPVAGRKDAKKTSVVSVSQMAVDTPSVPVSKATSGISKKRRSAGGGGALREEGKRLTLTTAALAAARKATAAASANDATKPGVGAKIIVTNLDPGVSKLDIKELFSGIGPLHATQLQIGESQNGRSATANVIFVDRRHALDAIKRYNGVPLDNRPMRISLASGASKKAADGRQLATSSSIKIKAGSGRRTVLMMDRTAERATGAGAGSSRRRRNRALGSAAMRD